jgi:hypothetical protein
MNLLDKIITQAKQETQLGPGDREHLRVQAELAKQKQQREDRARLAALESKLVADDQLHADELRAAFIRREKPSESAMRVFAAHQAVELQQKVVTRTQPKPILLSDGSYGTSPVVGKLLRLKAALAHEIKTHERVTALRPDMFEGMQRMGSNPPDFGSYGKNGKN